MLISVDDVRNKNKDLLLTDKIEDSEIESCIIDATETVMTRLNEVFDLPIPDDKVTSAMKLCIKLIAVSNCIKDNYSDNKEALDLSKDYFNEAEKNIKSIIAGNKLQKQNVLPHKKSISYKQDVDIQSDNFISYINTKYR